MFNLDVGRMHDKQKKCYLEELEIYLNNNVI